MKCNWIVVALAIAFLTPASTFAHGSGSRHVMGTILEVHPNHGTKTPAGIMIFLQIRPAAMKAHGMGM